MLRGEAVQKRALRSERIDADLVVVGGGLAGVCAALTAARAGCSVALAQDRPVLGGNASSEVRLWALGATAHMGNNNRWSREGGVIDEILVENVYRNPEGNPLLLDTLLLEKVAAEPNIRLLLNAAVFDLTKYPDDRIRAVTAFCSQNATLYELRAPLFCDASGDGAVAFLAGAPFRMGAEPASEFDEGFAPSAEYGELLGHSIYFYTKDVGRPVSFVAPAFALDDVASMLRYRRFNTRQHGCQLWWIEYGGRLDTVHDTEQIKWELWRVVYGVWDHVKNSGEFPEAETMTLEWVGMIPGKRESRRFEGDYMLHQRDIVEQRRHDDAISYGGWAIDLHPADGVFSEKPGCNQWHSMGTYQIPYRCMYSRTVRNLFLAGRIISASHVAFGSSRVMATGAHNAQAVGEAAALCRAYELMPRDLLAPQRLEELRRRLQRRGHYIPHVHVADPLNLAAAARVEATSRLALANLPEGADTIALEQPLAMLLPVQAGRMPRVSVAIEVDAPATIEVELRFSSRRGNFTPDVLRATRRLRVQPWESRPATTQPVVAGLSLGDGMRGGPRADNDDDGAAVANDALWSNRATWHVFDFDVIVDEPCYAFVCFKADGQARLRASDVRLTGVLTLRQKGNERVAEGARQTPPEDIGVDAFDFWLPERRPGGKLAAMRLAPPAGGFEPENVLSGPSRPTTQPNAWVAELKDPHPTLTLRWDEPQTIDCIELDFDTDFDHAMETVLMGHPERVMPYCVRRFRVLDEGGDVLFACEDNHQTRRTVRLETPTRTKSLKIELAHPSAHVPAALMAVRCYGPERESGA